MSVVAVAPTPQISLPDELKTVPPIQCGISGCTFSSHVLAKHLHDTHGMSVAQYQQLNVGPVESPVGAFVRQQVEAQRAGVAAAGQPAHQVMLAQPSAAASQSADQLHPLRPFTVGHRNMQDKDMFGTGVGTNKDKPFNMRVLSGFGPDDHVPEVDPYYTFDPDVMRWLVTALEVEDGMVYAFGPTGCGKTTVFEQYAARTGRPFAPIQLHAQMEASELTGTWVINANGQMTFQHAMLPIMMRLPSIIVLDEFDNANPAVTPVLNAVLADKPLVIPQTGERIVRHPLCRIVGTGNTAGMGDQTGLYNSTAQQSFATMNRWQMFMEMTYIDPANEARMLKSRFTEVPVILVDKITEFARQIREAFIGGQCSVVLSTRQLIHWLKWFDLTGELPDSYGYAFSNILHGSDRVFCDNLFQRVFGESAKKSRIQLAAAA